MKKRLMFGLAAGALMAAMLPGIVATAGSHDRVTGNARMEVSANRATDVSISAHSGPGGDATGIVNYRDILGGLPEDATVEVECIFVSGNQAIISGPFKKGELPFGALFPYAVVWVEDNGQPGGPVADRGRATGSALAPAANCTADVLSNGIVEADPLLRGDVKVIDAD